MAGIFLAPRSAVTALAHLRYSARSLIRTPGVALALLLTIAVGIGSNASVQGFIRGLITRDVPVAGIDTVVSLYARAAPAALAARGGRGGVISEPGPISYEEYLSLKTHLDAFEWLGAARESQGAVVVADRSLVMSVAAVTPELADLFDLPPGEGVVVSHRVWQFEFGARADVGGEAIRIDGVDTHVASVAPEWLEGLYLGRAVDLWMRLRDASLEGIDRGSPTLWALGRLRPGVSAQQAHAVVNASRGAGDGISVLPYSGLSPEMAAGMSRISTLLGAAAAAVFFIACANVASFLLARASARSQETSVRVALGASRGQLAKQLLADSVLIAVTGGALGLLLAVWTAQIVPALFFERDAEHLVFAPDLRSIVAASAACIAITIACGLMPLFELRHDDPAAVLRRESVGPSNPMRRLRHGLVVAQMTCCCVLVIATGLLLEGFRTALQTSVGHRLERPMLATLQARPASQSRHETSAVGLKYFHDVEDAAQSVAGVAGTAWSGRLPGSPPAWQSLRIERPQSRMRDVAMDVAELTPLTLALITLPPVAGRLFGAQDTSQTCRVVVVNEEAADDLSDGDAVGQSIEAPDGQRVEIVGVVATRKTEHATTRVRPTVYYYPEQGGAPLDRVGPARFRVRTQLQPARALLDAHVVSPGYFDAMGLTPIAGTAFPADSTARGCRIGVINQEAADRYFDGNAVGAAVIDNAGRRTEIIGVVHSALLRTFQRSVEPAIYFPMGQDFLPRMTLILGAPKADATLVATVRRRLAVVPGGGPDPIVVTTLDAHLSRTALAPMRIAMVLVGASAATALALGVLGLYGAMMDAARQRRRDIAVRIALGAQGWGVTRQVLADGLRLAAAGTVAGMLGSLMVAGWLARITPRAGPLSGWVWLAAPLVLVGAVAIASVVPARRALAVDPLTIMRDDY